MMRKSLKKIGALCMIGILMLAGCSEGSSGSNQFVVGMECGYAPYNWTQPTAADGAVAIDNGQFCNGYDVEVAKRIAESLGKELVIQRVSWDGLILSLQSDQIDAIIAGMSPTSERKQEIDFSDVYHLGTFGVMVRKDSKYADAKTVNDFADLVVSAQLGTFHVDLMEQLVGAKVLEPMKDFPTMTVALTSGELDGFVADNATGVAVSASNPGLTYIPLTGPNGFAVREDYAGSSIGIKKGNPLLEEVNKALSEITTEERQKLMEQAIELNKK